MPRFPKEKPQAAAPKRSIDCYTLEAKERQSIGHFEVDATHGKQGGRVVQNKIDRKTRKMFLDFAPTQEAKPYADLCIERLKRDIPPGVLKTLLQDNGAEHADHARLERALNILTFFCHPYSASERGTVENTHAALADSAAGLAKRHPDQVPVVDSNICSTCCYSSSTADACASTTGGSYVSSGCCGPPSISIDIHPKWI